MIFYIVETSIAMVLIPGTIPFRKQKTQKPYVFEDHLEIEYKYIQNGRMIKIEQSTLKGSTRTLVPGCTWTVVVGM
jgi:hypothetical protein